MSYYLSRTVETGFGEAVGRVTEKLKQEGFGILTEIDVQETLKKKLGADFRKYRILGACNPPLAYEAVQAEDKVGVMLLCNVILQEIGALETEIAAIDPIASMQAIDNPALKCLAELIREKLQRVIENL